jgi:hypothetical protein
MQPTTSTTQDLKQHLQQSLESLKTLRDEIRVDIHLAGMEVKDSWKRLEHRFGDAENFAREASYTSKQALEEIIDTFKSFRASLGTKAEKKNDGAPEQPGQRPS